MYKAAIAAVLLAAAASAQDFTINTPASLVECQPAAINWKGGKAPYIIDVIPGGQVSAAALEELISGTSDTSFTWTVNLASGTSVTLKLTDSSGTIAYSSPNTIQAGSDTSCLNSTATSAAGAAGATGASGSAGASSSTSSTGSTDSSMSMTSSASASHTSAAATSAVSRSSASASRTSASGSASAAASSGAAYLNSNVQLPALLLAAVGGVAALL